MRPKRGIATDGAHSMKRGVTRYRAVNLATGELLFEQNIGNQTINIGEFLGVVEAAKYIIEHRFSPAIIYTDSLTALTWFNEKRTASRKRNAALKKAEIFLKAMASEIDKIEVLHWNNSLWGETPLISARNNNSTPRDLWQDLKKTSTNTSRFGKKTTSN